MRGSRAAAALFAYLGITLAPFHFGAADLSWIVGVFVPDLVGNVLFTIPLGWLLCDAVGPSRTLWMLPALAFGVESAQVFLEGRQAGLWDVVANAAGGFAGVVWRLRRPADLETGRALLVLAWIWAVASRYGAPGRPVFAAGILAALGVAALRARIPRRSSDVAAYALIGVGPVAGLSPPPLTVSVGIGTLVGALAWRRTRAMTPFLAIGAVGTFLLETWPPFRVSARPGDGVLMVVEVALGAFTVIQLALPARSAPGSPGTPGPSPG